MVFRGGSRTTALLLGSAVGLAVVAGLTMVMIARGSVSRVAFVQSHFALPAGWSVSPMIRTPASSFQPATETFIAQGPQGLDMHLTYTPGAPNLGGFGGIPLHPNPFGIRPGSHVISTPSPYVEAVWSSRGLHQALLTSTVETLHGTYEWSTSVGDPSQQALLSRIYHSWHYPQPVTVTEAVHAMVHQKRLYTKILAWHRSSGAMLTAGIPATGQAPWYLFTTRNHGKQWHLTDVSRFVPATRSDGFPRTSPSDALVAMVLTSARTIWIDQTINCMAGPEPTGGTVTLAKSLNDGQSWQKVTNRIHELAGYCPTALGLSARSESKQPTVHLTEQNAQGNVRLPSWTPRQWEAP